MTSTLGTVPRGSAGKTLGTSRSPLEPDASEAEQRIMMNAEHTRTLLSGFREPQCNGSPDTCCTMWLGRLCIKERKPHYKYTGEETNT